MAHDTEARNTEQRGAAELGVIHSLPKAAERPPRQQVAHLARKRALQLLAEQVFDHLDQPFAQLQRHVAGEPVTDHHVGVARKNAPGFNVPDKRERRGFQELVRVARQLVSLRFFLANRQQPDSRPFDAEPGPRIHRAHVRELQEVRRLALHGGARIQQHRRAVPGRHRRRQCRTIHARQHAERRVGSDDARAGMAGAEQRARMTRGHVIRGDANRRLGLAPQRLGGRFRHFDNVGRVDDTHVEGTRVRISLELGVDQVRATNQVNTETEVAGRGQRAFDRPCRRVIAAHRVNGDAHHQVRPRLRQAMDRSSSGTRQRSVPPGRLILVDGADLAGAIVTAIRAHAVRGFRLTALRAQAGCRGLERVVRAALAAAGLGVSAFWIRHRRAFASLTTSSSQPTGDPPSCGLQSHGALFRLVPHCGQIPLQSLEHNGFIGNAR